jgi:hypothetical protein
MLTQNQKKIIDQLVVEFEVMNKAQISSENPLLELWDKFNEDKENANQLQMVEDAKILALQEKIQTDLNKVMDYFDELGCGNLIDFSTSFTGPIGFARLRYTPGSRYFYPIDVYGRIRYNTQRVGEFVVYTDSSIYYELGDLKKHIYDNIEDLLKSYEFKDRVADFFYSVNRFKEYN